MNYIPYNRQIQTVEHTMLMHSHTSLIHSHQSLIGLNRNNAVIFNFAWVNSELFSIFFLYFKVESSLLVL